MSDTTRMMPTAGGPEPGGPDRRVAVIAALVGVIVVLILLLVVVRAVGDDGGSTASSSTTETSTSTSSTTPSSSTTTESTTTTSSTTSTTTSTTTTTTTSTTTTTTTPPSTTSTVAPDRCTGATGPTKPGTVAQVFYEAWTVDDRNCASQIATSDAVDTLFAIDGSGAQWTFEGCSQTDGPDQHTECAYSYEGGAAFFSMRFGATTGWQIYAVDFATD